MLWMRRFGTAAIVGVCLALFIGAAGAQDGEMEGGGEVPDPPKVTGDPWPLDTCPVSGKALGSMGDPVIHNFNGREIRFCCERCVGKWEAEAPRFLPAADRKIVEQQKDRYPLDRCLISGEDFEEDGPLDIVWHNRLVRLCCKICRRDFHKDPTPYLEHLDDKVIEAQSADYPLDTCPVSGEELEDGGRPLVIHNRLIRVCCRKCERKVRADPLRWFAKLDEAAEDE